MVSVLIVLVLAAATPRSTWAQTKKVKAESQNKKLYTPTGWPINFTYFNSTQGKESPVLMLLHDKGGNQKIWEPTAKTLQGKGFAVVTVDLRKHGQSKPEDGGKMDVRPVDYPAMLQDIETVKGFLLQEHQAQKLNIRKLGIVAMGMSVPIALNYAQIDWLKKPYPDAPSLAARTPKGQDVRALMMLSPVATLPRVATTKPLKFLRAPELNVAMLFYYGDLDRKVQKDAEKMYKMVAPNSDAMKRMHKVARSVKVNGTQLLSSRRKEVDTVLAKFFDDHLKQLESPWRDRKSRLGN